jgi:hypothetical protein
MGTAFDPDMVFSCACAVNEVIRERDAKIAARRFIPTSWWLALAAAAFVLSAR